MKKIIFYQNVDICFFFKSALIILLITAFSSDTLAQDSNNKISSIYSSTSITIGSSDLLETYLSPIDYKGINIGVVNERIFKPSFIKNEWIAQQFIRGDYSSNNTIYGSNNTVTGFLEYSFGMLYKLPKITPSLDIYTGPYAYLEGGFVYNLRNGNNPASAKVDISMGASIMACYKLKLIKKHPFNIRYQLSVPVVGAFFCPNYEQSYYEIFSLGNNKGIVHPGIWGKKFEIDNLITIDVPFNWIGLRVGFENRIYNNHANNLKYRRILNSFIIGFTKNFIPNNPKKNTINHINVINPIF